ncbi:MAG: hypothetical protein GX757_06675 [Clostridiales bacterium]|nr:hypothetical protein [Clostridiales bacterium]
MKKTRLGITVGLLGASIYFMSMVSILGLIILAGYVLLFEENPWLKKSAVKAVIITVAFSLISMLISMGNNAFAILNTMISWTPVNLLKFQFKYPFGLETIIRNGLSILENILYLILGIKALKQGSIKIGFIDNFINKHMDQEQN